MPHILLTPRLAPEVLAIAEGLLPVGFTLDIADPSGPPAALATALAPAEYLLGFVGPLPEEAWAAATHLRLIQLLSAGYDRFPIERARERGVPVALNGGANAVAVAEHAVMLMLAVYRRLTQLDRAVHRGEWRAGAGGEARYHELGGKRVGLLGMGQIGRAVARRLAGFDVDLCYTDVVRLPPDEERTLGATFLPFEQLVASADVLSLHLPLLPETRGIIDARALASVRPGTVLINTARGELVDEAALAAALRSGQLLGAGLDVLSQEPPPPEHPLLALDNIVITPHTAGPTWESWPRRFSNAYANIVRVSQGEPPRWVIPELRE
jgi:phosphoglycerate dehydrogenase-like enzyme